MTANVNVEMAVAVTAVMAVAVTECSKLLVALALELCLLLERLLLKEVTTRTLELMILR